MSSAIAIRDLRTDEWAWANAQYEAIEFATTPPGNVALVAEQGAGGTRIGLGRLVAHGSGVVEMGGIWTADAARGAGVARAMVTALLERARGVEPLWCIPFGHLAAFYESFGFARRAAPWPAPIAAKVAACIERGQTDVVVLAR